MNPEDIGRILDEIGRRIGPYGEATWTILVTQKRLEGIVGMGSAVVLFLLATTFSVVFYKLAKKKVAEFVPHGYSTTTDWDPASWAVPLAAMVTVLIPVLPLLALNVLKVFNPEYYAVETLLYTLGSALP